MTKIQLITQDYQPVHSPPQAGHSNNLMESMSSAKVYCWPSFFSPSDEPELLLLLSRSAAICREEQKHTKHIYTQFKIISNILG